MGFFSSIFGGDDSGYKDANNILNKQAAELPGYYNPYIQTGQRQAPALEEKYAALRDNPEALQHLLGDQYEQSPGYQFQYNQAMNGANAAAAAGGYAGTPAHQYQAGQLAQGLASQDYWNHYGANERLFNTGLEGTQQLYNTGYNASDALASNLGATYGSQANLAYTKGQNTANRNASLLGAGIGAGGYALGGPLGGAAATGISNWFKG